MNVACSTFCFGRHPLDRALRIIGELEFSKLDVAIHEDGPHLTPTQVVQDIGLAAQRIRIGPSLTPGAFSVEIAADQPADYQRQLRAICRPPCSLLGSGGRVAQERISIPRPG